MNDPKRAFFGQNPFAQDRAGVHADADPVDAAPSAVDAVAAPMAPVVPDSREVLDRCREERASGEHAPMGKAFG